MCQKIVRFFMKYISQVTFANLLVPTVPFLTTGSLKTGLIFQDFY